MSNGFSLDGRLAQVTGANAGIGQAIAVAMARAGAKVICAGRSSMQGTLDMIQAAGGRGRAVVFDLIAPVTTFPSLFDGNPIDNLVNIASLLSLQRGIRVPSYTASKHGLLCLTRLLANEWAARGINVKAVAPGYVETSNTEALRADPDRSRAILERISVGRWGRPDDIAGAAVFLASPAARYIHGAVLSVDGGWMAR
ncbi:MAG: SDR family oxidoreductase [Paracoccaceae bacterium]